MKALRVVEEGQVVEPACRLSCAQAQEALGALDDLPAGWLERTRPHSPDSELAFRAVYTLASWLAFEVADILDAGAR